MKRLVGIYNIATFNSLYYIWILVGRLCLRKGERVKWKGEKAMKVNKILWNKCEWYVKSDCNRVQPIIWMVNKIIYLYLDWILSSLLNCTAESKREFHRSLGTTSGSPLYHCRHHPCTHDHSTNDDCIPHCVLKTLISLTNRYHSKQQYPQINIYLSFIYSFYRVIFII